jgi:hypothetical protein
MGLNRTAPLARRRAVRPPNVGRLEPSRYTLQHETQTVRVGIMEQPSDAASSQQSLDQEPKRRLPSRTLLLGKILLGVMLFAILLIAWRRLVDMNDRLAYLQSQVADLSAKVEQSAIDLGGLKFDSLRGKPGYVSLTESSIQDHKTGFLASDIDLEEHLTGYKVKGRIINNQAVRQRSIKFRLTVADQTKEFVLDQLNPGGSRAFSVYLPDLEAEDIQFGRIEFIESQVAYSIR